MDVVVFDSLLDVSWEVVSAPTTDPDPCADGSSAAAAAFDRTNPVVDNDILRAEATGGKLDRGDDADDVAEEDATRS